jgi:lysophospholipase L1-like esterase
MLDDHGQPRPELFTSDMLHMNAKGYAIWQKVIRPELLK